jgi:antitoxin component of RelBE/YafQ-DinJ toxin-antitoxin module
MIAIMGMLVQEVVSGGELPFEVRPPPPNPP